MEISNTYIPRLNEHLSVIPFDSKSYLICIDGEQPTKFKISAISKMLIDQIDGKRNIDEIATSFNHESGASLPMDTILKIFNDNLLGYGVLQDDTVEKVKVKDNYLKLRFILFPNKLVRKMVKPILGLFTPAVFKAVFVACAVFISFFYIRDIRLGEFYKGITPSFAAWFVLLNVISIIFHELGHAGACERFGANSGPIGFGFYLFTPVFYADVSDAWRLKRGERLIVDLAGIYMQVIFCAVFVSIYLINGNAFFLHIAFLISTTVIVNINPFLRYDGYWALCDLINVPNLRENSMKLMKQFFRWVIRKTNTWKSSVQNVFLVLYALSSSIFIVYFFFMMVVYKRNSIFMFPVDLFNFFAKIITDFRSISFDWVKGELTGFILPFIFYLFLYRIVIKRLFKYLKNNTNGA